MRFTAENPVKVAPLKSMDNHKWLITSPWHLCCSVLLLRKLITLVRLLVADAISPSFRWRWIVKPKSSTDFPPTCGQVYIIQPALMFWKILSSLWIAFYAIVSTMACVFKQWRGHLQHAHTHSLLFHFIPFPRQFFFSSFFSVYPSSPMYSYNVAVCSCLDLLAPFRQSLLCTFTTLQRAQ